MIVVVLHNEGGNSYMKASFMYVNSLLTALPAWPGKSRVMGKGLSKYSDIVLQVALYMLRPLPPSLMILHHQDSTHLLAITSPTSQLH